MKIQSRDGKFNISVSDSAKRGCKLEGNAEFDNEVDVYLEAIKKEISILDIAYTIFNDCFCGSCNGGLQLLAKKLKCHVNIKEKTYIFILPEHNSLEKIVYDIADQIIL